MKILNPGIVANPTEWLNDQLAQAVKWGFPFASIAMVNHALATALLERNDTNRPLRNRRAMRYRHDMETGQWVLNGETIVITADGRMPSGQHRCAAILDTEMEVPMFIVFGVDARAAVTVDQGAPKSAGDYLAVQGEANAATTARIARLRLCFDANEGEAIRDTSKPTNADILQYVRDHKDDIERSAALAIELREYTKPLVAPSVIGFAHNVFHDVDADAADRFVQQVARQEGLKEGDPAYAVARKLLNMGKAGAAPKAEALFVGFLATLRNRSLHNIRITGRLPRLTSPPKPDSLE